MNNANTNNLPNAPDDIAAWEFYHQLHICTVNYGRGEDSQKAFRTARRVLLQQMSLMARTICRACSGHGHRARDCPTNLRLGVLQSASV